MSVAIAVVIQPAADAQTGKAPAAASSSPTLVEIPAVLETQPEFDDDAGGNADVDDPAIWVNPDDPARSLVIGTLKDAGLSVFDLDGKQIQRIAAPAAPGPDDAAGRFNNVDVLTDFELRGKEVDIAVVTDRGRDQLRIFTIDARKAAAGKAPLTDVTDPAVPFLFNASQEEVNAQATAYGLSVYHDDDRALALVSQELRSTLGSVELRAKGRTVTYKVLRKASLPTEFDLPDGTTFTPCQEPGEQPFSEGIFVDEEDGVAYVAQETVGLWRMDADLKDFEPELFDKVKEFGVPAVFDVEADECVVTGDDPGFGGKNLSTDIEGTTVFDAGDGDGYLLVSSQGNNTIAAYEREGRNRFIGSFRIVNGQGEVDSVEETDGMTVSNFSLGQFQDGLMVLQDGSNTPDVEGGEDGEPRENSNFKFVSWGTLAAGFDPPLDVNPED
ncbi:phytase [Actinoplanes sp. NPDC051346]|uniref:phytase n=1 Tax=Actinoplanes sp. NPDC051346 TaxID=3155048 RepID=UPI0034139C0F